MDWVYWLIFFAVATPVGLYINRWHKRPSDLPSATIISFAHQTLEIVSFHLREEDGSISRTEVIDPYLKKRELNWRQSRDVISYLTRANWLYQLPADGNSYVRYMITSDGRRELETAGSMKQAAQGTYPNLGEQPRMQGLFFSNIENLVFSNSGSMSWNDERQELSARLADALRVDSRSADQPEERRQAEDLAGQIDDAVVHRDPARLDKLIGRTRDVLQAASYAFPLAHEIIQLILK